MAGVKGAKDGCRAPPDAGLIWYFQLTVSIYDGFANKLESSPYVPRESSNLFSHGHRNHEGLG